MNITLASIKDFWKLPQGKQFLSACFVVIIALSSVITYQNTRVIPPLYEDKIRAAKEYAQLRKECGDEKLTMQRQCDSEKTAMRNVELTELRTRLAEKEAIMDEAIQNANQVIITQRKTQQNVKRITQQVNKLVTDEK